MAGVFDCHGHLRSRFHAGGTEIRVGVVNSSRPLLERFQARFGGNIYPTARNTLSWELYDRVQVRLFLQAIGLHVIVRRAEVEAALDWLILNPPRRGRKQGDTKSDTPR